MGSLPSSLFIRRCSTRYGSRMLPKKRFQLSACAFTFHTRPSAAARDSSWRSLTTNRGSSRQFRGSCSRPLDSNDDVF
uniref:Secreted protein n=1 Tax=Ascaris lumbricoides TaxID=6252 RepID=A0A0M3ISG5_ASCLU